jgi:multiple sugar transport system permease protein
MIMRRLPLKSIMIHAMALVIVIFILAPYAWLVISSISTKVDLLEVPLKWIPKHPTLSSYSAILTGKGQTTSDTASQFIQAMKNSAIVSISVTACSLFFGVLAAYGFARFQFRGRNSGLLTILVTQMVPPIAIIIPLYVIISRLGLMNHKITLIVVYLSFVLPFVIWIMRGYLANIPVELEEAARIEGCSRMRAFIEIILPLSSSGLAATTIFAFILSWNEFFYALNFTTTLTAKTLPVLITEFSSKFGADYILTSTGGVLASLPPVLLALIFQKFILEGLTSGAIKG